MDISKYILKNTLKLLVKPNSPKTEVLGYDEPKKALKIALHAQPEKGKANLELIKFFKKEFKKDIKIISGLTSKEKLIKIL
jgi:uncharacterized protein